MISLLVVLVLGCSKGGKAPASEPAPPAPAEPAAEPAAATLPKTPEGFYAMCEERVEGPGMAGECTQDADCLATGCSGEVCVEKAVGEGMSTTCELAPCFQVLDSCGCRGGRCSWSLKPELPAALRRLVEAVDGG